MCGCVSAAGETMQKKADTYRLVGVCFFIGNSGRRAAAAVIA